MNTRESEFAKKITAYLDRGAADARRHALPAAAGTRAALAAWPQPARAAARADGARACGRRGHGPCGRRPAPGPLRCWLGMALLSRAPVSAISNGRPSSRSREFEELDVQILSSDLPIDAYLDRGFQNWLKTRRT